MTHKLVFTLCAVLITSCASIKPVDKVAIAATIDAWHLAAAQTRFDDYFNLMTSDAVFIGTDASENWDLASFKAFSKPFFNRGQAWSFTSLQRNVYKANSVIYFDELLDTQMGICRGSGVLKKENGTYKIAHYVLSIAVPNEHVTSLTVLKNDWDTDYKKQLNQKNR